MQAQPTIFEATAECRTCFTVCQQIEKLQDGEWAENRLADFNLWASGIGASARYRASLDARLALRQDAREVIINLLHLLKSLLDKCVRLGKARLTSLYTFVDIVYDLAQPDAASDNEGNSDEDEENKAGVRGDPAVSLSWSDDSSLDSEPDEIRDNSSKAPLPEAMRNVDRQLEQLARIALTIRRSGTRARLQKADRSFRPHDHEDLRAHLVAVIFTRKYPHRKDRFSPKSIDPQKLDDVQSRLINCNLKRRNRFLYAQKHSKGLDEMRSIKAKPVQEPALRPQPEGKILLQDQLPSIPKPLSAMPARPLENHSLNTGTSASRVTGLLPISQNPVPSQAATTQLSTTVVNLDYPHPPKMHAAALVFKCPCCCQALPAMFSDKNRWKKHVAEDLAPYTCVMPHCVKPDMLYSTREAWKTHLLEDHSSVDYWVCFACINAVQFDKEDAFVAHVLHEHQDSVSQSQLPTLKAVCKRSAPAEIRSCPLCPWPSHEDGEVDRAAIIDHIAEDVHNFSLQSLPWAPEEKDENKERTDFSVTKVENWSWNPEDVDENGEPIDLSSARIPEHMTKQKKMWESDAGPDSLPEREPKEPTLPHYFDENEYFAQDLKDSSDSLTGSENTLKKSLKELRAEVSLAYSETESIEASGPKTFWNVPFPRNPNFVGRRSLLEQLEKGLSDTEQPRTVTIFGEASIGKTQVAIELAYRTREKFPECSVFWIAATNSVAHGRAYVDIHSELYLQKPDDEHYTVQELLEYHLNQDRAGPWLMIFDDVKDNDVWTSICAHLPKNRQGYVAVVTRHPRFSLAYCPTIGTGPMDSDEAKDLFLRFIGRPVGQGDQVIIKLLRKLPSSPHAIVLAAAYIRESGGTSAAYEALSHIYRERTATRMHEPITDALYMLRDLLSRNRPDTINCWYTMSFMDPSDIPVSLFQPPASDTGPVANLVSYGLVQEKLSRYDSVCASRLLHEQTNRFLTTPEQTNIFLTSPDWVKTVVELLSNQLSDIHVRSYGSWKVYGPHVLYLFNTHRQYLRTEEGEELLRKYSEYLYRTEGFHEAQRVLEYEQESVRERNGDAPSLALQMNQTALSRIYWAQGKFSQATETADAALEHQKKLFGNMSKDALIGMANLALIHFSNGRYDKAEGLELDVLRGMQNALGDDDPLTITAMDNLAATYAERNRWLVAEGLEKELVVRRTNLLGESHPDTIDSIRNLATVYEHEEEWGKAKEQVDRAARLLENLLGADHPETLKTIARRAYMTRQEGKRDAAVEILKEVWTRQAAVLGEKHIATQDSLDMLAEWQAEDMLGPAPAESSNMDQSQNLYAQATTRAGRQHTSTEGRQQPGIPPALQRVITHLDDNAPIRSPPSPAYWPQPDWSSTL